jgi:DNA-binding NtrC family response regulator
MVIRSPALRDHTEDIPQLARHFLAEYSQLYQKSVSRITPAAMSVLMEYDWPGNVRELENAIQSAIILSDGDAVQPEDLPDSMQHADFVGAGNSLPGTSFEDQMQDYKLKLAYKAIDDCQGNKTLAARSLQISRTYLHRLIRSSAPDNCLSLPTSAPN